MTTVLPRADQGVKEGIHVRVLDAPNVTKIDGSSAEVCLEKHIPEVSGDGKAGDDSARWLTVSPYLDPEHLLDLNTVDTPNRLLALAATQLEPATADYAIVKYEDAFEWTSFMTDLKSLADRENYRWTRQEFYVVEFRSQLKKNIDVDLLFQLDKLSHVEATAGGGLLKYWYGVPNAERQNLATCLWRSKEDAIKGGRGPWHKQARAIIAKMYEEIDVKGLRLVIEEGVESWSFSPFN